jgi:uncharacterized protein (TIGR04141 family)
MGQHLTVYHIRQELADTIQEPKDSYKPLLNESKAVDEYSSASAINFVTRLFVEKSISRTPPWLGFLQQGFNSLPELKTRSTNAVLFVRVPFNKKKEIFAFTFGQGRFLLRPRSYDEKYGLRVALNIIYQAPSGSNLEPERLKSVSTTTLAANTLRTRRQTDKKATFEAFGVDIQSDSLTGVTGLPVSPEGWSRQISGSDSLTATPIVTLRDLKKYCLSIIDSYRARHYKTNFDWIDTQKSVNDSVLIKNLINYVITLIKGKQSEEVKGKIEVTVPEIVDWDDVDYFYFSFDKDNKILELGEVNLTESLRDKKLLTDLKSEHLKEKWHLFMCKADGSEVDWPLLECLTGEIDLTGATSGLKGTFILSEGSFYEISNKYIDKLNTYIANVSENKDLITTSTKEKTEGSYNLKTAKKCPDLLFMDKALVRLAGNTSPIEVCDLLTPAGRFIHVKKELHSSNLSHLFLQGYTSAELLLMNPDYKPEVLKIVDKQEKDKNKELPTGAPSCIGKFRSFLAKPINPGEIEVTFAIIAKWKGKAFVEAMPFFARVAFRKNAENLRRMGIKVSYARIERVQPVKHN